MATETKISDCFGEDEDGVNEEITFSVDIREIRQRHKSSSYKQSISRFRAALQSQLERVQRKQFDSGDSSADETTLEWLERLQGRTTHRSRAAAIEPAGPSQEVLQKERIDVKEPATDPEAFPAIAYDHLIASPTHASSSLNDLAISAVQAALEDSVSASAFVPPEVNASLRPRMALGQDDDPRMASLAEETTNDFVVLTPSDIPTDSTDELVLEKTTKQKDVKQQCHKSDFKKHLLVCANERNENIRTGTATVRNTLEVVEEKEVMTERCREGGSEAHINGSSSRSLDAILQRQLYDLLTSESCPPDIEYVDDVAENEAGRPVRVRVRCPSHKVHQQTENHENDECFPTNFSKHKRKTVASYADTEDKRRLQEHDAQEKTTAATDKVKMFGKLESGKRRFTKKIPRKLCIDKPSSGSDIDENNKDQFEYLLQKLTSLDKGVHAKLKKDLKSHFRQTTRVIRRVKKRSRPKSDKPEVGGRNQDMPCDVPQPKRIKRSTSRTDITSEITQMEKVVQHEKRGQKYSAKSFWRKEYRKRSKAMKSSRRDCDLQRRESSTSDVLNSTCMENIQALEPETIGSYYVGTLTRESVSAPEAASERNDLSFSSGSIPPELSVLAPNDEAVQTETPESNVPNEAAESPVPVSRHFSHDDELAKNMERDLTPDGQKRQSKAISRTPLLKLKSELQRKRLARRSERSSVADLLESENRSTKLGSKRIVMFIMFVLLVLLVTSFVMRLVLFCNPNDRCWRCYFEYTVSRTIQSQGSVFHMKQPPI